MTFHGWQQPDPPPLINPAGYLRSLQVVFQGSTSTGGAFASLAEDWPAPPRARLPWRRCRESSRAGWRCQGRRDHTEPHYVRRGHGERRELACWILPDPPFNMITERK